ncbi:radical SAM protein [Marivita geojedonensis]|uniref:radical SAM protein n=1 Tax=Marivita geojedonensis TaxID=1123756 RepID=UPI00117BE9AF|nr:radical SAM protein [Marivita geojedonensis]
MKLLVPDEMRNILRSIRDMSRLAKHQARRDLFGELFPPKPNSISLMANDVCNARCEMCGIWEGHREKGPTLEEFKRIFQDPLFDKVLSLGVTGGEPTLRPDLDRIFQAGIENLSSLRYASIITNALQPDRVVERILASRDVCRDAGVDFSAMVSLDGVGVVHDRVRGRNGNFERAVKVIDRLREAGVALSVGCTITKTNADHVDELLDWVIENDLLASFRIAEFIDRLYNNDNGDQIRNFTDAQLYNLALFYMRLNASYETRPAVRKTYSSIKGMLVDNKKRMSGCQYHYDGVIISAQRGLLYCSPKSPTLGNLLEQSGSKLFFGNIDKRDAIKKDHCDDCIHDYHAEPKFTEKVGFYLQSKRHASRYSIERLTASARRTAPCAQFDDPQTLRSNGVLIVGWYGTETVGDQAILWGVLDRLRRRANPPKRIILASLHPFISRQTRVVLDLDDIKIIETYSAGFEEICNTVDEVVVAGGPLMDLQALDHMLFAFTCAASRKAVARVEGCGLGPLREPRFIGAVGQMLRLASTVELRDQASVDRSRSDFGVDARKIDDPAIAYVEQHLRQGVSMPASDERREVCFFLRKVGAHYLPGMTDDERAGLNDRFEEELLSFMATIVKERELRLRLLPMCHHWIGGDDRVFNRHLKRKLIAGHGLLDEDIQVENLPVSPDEILTAMRGAELNICMRYHSVVFAEQANAPYLAVDYTQGGKIAGFLNDIGRPERAISLAKVTAGRMLDATESVWSSLV